MTLIPKRKLTGPAVILGAQPPTATILSSSPTISYISAASKRRESLLFLTLTERAARNDGIPREIRDIEEFMKKK